MLKAFEHHARSQMLAFVTVPAIHFCFTRRLRLNILRKSSSSSSSLLLLNEAFFTRRVSNSRCHCSSSSSSRPSSAIMGSSSALGELLHYPSARRDDSVVEDYHGVKIADPYRWLEDPDAEEVKEFVESQVKLTDSVLAKCETKEKLSENITALFDHPRYESPFRKGDKYFYFHNTGLQAQDVLYMQRISMLTETNSNLYHELYYHFLGTDQSQDILCWRDSENPKYMFGAEVTDDGKFLIMTIEEGCDPVNKLYYCDLSSLSGGLESFRGSSSFLPFIKLVDTLDAQYNVISNDETLFTFLTNKDAPKYKLVRVDLKEPNSWTDVVEEHEKDVLASACAVNGNQLVTCYMSDVKHILQIRDMKSGSLLHQLPLDIGSVSDVSARRKDNTFFFSFTSFLTPGVIYKCDLANEAPEVKVFREVAVPGFDREAFQATQVFYPSKDGTKIPMFIVAKKDIKLDGSHPCLLYAYGGFNISITPSFSASRIVLSKHLGAVFCIANIRGGGEYGEEWHKAGSLANKQNCFDDFISGAEYLVSAGYTQPSKLCIEGGSNGGLLIGACINQRPDLYGCALAHVGVMDMLRFHKFTIGHAWTTDYGCSENEEEFHWLIKYSPLHNVKRPWEQQSGNSVQYPSTMLLTADHDDRVVPLHSLKLLATLQHVLCTSLENSPQTNPIIGRIEVKAGHGAGRPTKKMIDEAADRYSFMAKMVNAPWTE
ncbi:unnamed protein product [Brassica rapa]|uniref:Prolyl endopeptidase n=1 Tax=Brassica campestris TaxID=3711 RepID=A0A8D9MCH2_BRACM|nr:unnamed protein product [Brassica rapa]